MPIKEGGGNKPQEYDESTGQYTKFKHFAKPISDDVAKKYKAREVSGRYYIEDRSTQKEIYSNSNAIKEYMKENNILGNPARMNREQLKGLLEYVKDKPNVYEKEEIKPIINEDVEQVDRTEIDKANNQKFRESNIDENGQKYIEEDIMKYIDDHYADSNTNAQIDSGDFSVDFDYDTEGYTINSITNQKEAMNDLLKSSNADFEWSKRSNSLYITKEGKKYRVSDHKMPMIDGIYDRNEKYINKIGKSWNERIDYVKDILNSVDYDSEILKLKEQRKGLSIFNPKTKEITAKINELEAQKKGFNSYNDYLADTSRKNDEQKKIAEENKTIEYTNSEHKNKQFDIIQETNPMRDEYHTGIRQPDEIKTFEEAIKSGESVYPDFTQKDINNALKEGYVTVYSSKPINQGGFVSTSKMMAQDYAGSGKVYSQKVKLDDVAWIDINEGQYAKI